MFQTAPKNHGFSSHRFCSSIKLHSFHTHSTRESQAVITTTARHGFSLRVPEAFENRRPRGLYQVPNFSHPFRKNAENPRILGHPKQNLLSLSKLSFSQRNVTPLSHFQDVCVCERDLGSGSRDPTYANSTLRVPTATLMERRMLSLKERVGSSISQPRHFWPRAPESWPAMFGQGLWVGSMGGVGRVIRWVRGSAEEVPAPIPCYVLGLCQWRGLVGLCVLPSVMIWGPLFLSSHLYDGLLGFIFPAKRVWLVQSQKLGERRAPREASYRSGT